MDVNDLKGFIDLGGVFILALVMMRSLNSKLDKIVTATDKLLVVVLLIGQKTIGGNPITSVIDKEHAEIKDMLNDLKGDGINK